MVRQHNEPCRLGIGLYSISDAARLLRVHPQRVRHWIEPEGGLIRRKLEPTERTISFLELMELHFINMFREAGVSLQTIQEAAKTAAKAFETPYPFAVHRFDTDGRTVFATLIKREKDTSLVKDLRRGQYVFDTIIRPFFKRLEYRGNEAVRFWPREKTGRIVLDPNRRFGKPIDAPTGVPTVSLFHAVEAGEDVATVASWFGVPVAAITAAVAFEKSLAA
ncbi:MAG: MerR family transcriptional regulator [Planctomycetia bacterium]|nr:MerR family transcriptional regulator [Planctomycetia bacterium]